MTIGADHHPSPLDDLPPAVGVAPDADHRALLDEHLVDGEALADLDPGSRRGVDEHLVEDRAPRSDGGGVAVDRAGAAAHHDRSEVEGVLLDRWAPGGGDLVVEAPPLERGHAVGLDDQRRERVAGKGRPVDEQDPVTRLG